MRSRETKTREFCVPTGDLVSSMGGPLKKTQAHAAAQLTEAPGDTQPTLHPRAMLTCASASLLPDLPPLGASE